MARQSRQAKAAAGTVAAHLEKLRDVHPATIVILDMPGAGELSAAAAIGYLQGLGHDHEAGELTVGDPPDDPTS